MDISFSSAKLGKLCCSQAEMVQRWGHRIALLICQRLLEIYAAGSLAELQSLPHIDVSLKDVGERAVKGSLAVGAGVRMTIIAVSKSDEKQVLDDPDHERFTSVIIQSIECEQDKRSTHGN